MSIAPDTVSSSTCRVGYSRVGYNPTLRAGCARKACCAPPAAAPTAAARCKASVGERMRRAARLCARAQQGRPACHAAAGRPPRGAPLRGPRLHSQVGAVGGEVLHLAGLAQQVPHRLRVARRPHLARAGDTMKPQRALARLRTAGCGALWGWLDRHTLGPWRAECVRSASSTELAAERGRARNAAAARDVRQRLHVLHDAALGYGAVGAVCWQGTRHGQEPHPRHRDLCSGIVMVGMCSVTSDHQATFRRRSLRCVETGTGMRAYHTCVEDCDRACTGNAKLVPAPDALRCGLRANADRRPRSPPHA